MKKSEQTRRAAQRYLDMAQKAQDACKGIRHPLDVEIINEIRAMVAGAAASILTELADIQEKLGD